MIFLSFSFSKVLLAISAGTEQPNPIRSGINDFPLKPNLLNNLSITKATLAIYPLSSRIDINKNNTKICGKNDTTPPSPASIPSPTSDNAHSLAPIFCRELSIVSVNGPSQKSPTIVCSHTPRPNGPSPKVILNNPYIIAKNAGIAIILFVSTLSILSEVVSTLVPSFLTCFCTDFETTFEINLYL